MVATYIEMDALKMLVDMTNGKKDHAINAN